MYNFINEHYNNVMYINSTYNKDQISSGMDYLLRLRSVRHYVCSNGILEYHMKDMLQLIQFFIYIMMLLNTMCLL